MAVLMVVSLPLSVYAEEAPLPVASEEVAAAPSEAPAAPVAAPSETDAAEATTDVQAEQNHSVTATTGDAVVTENQTAGSAQSGTATADTTAATIVNSTTDLANAGTFTKDVDGTVVGDITLEPLITTSLQDAVASQHLLPSVAAATIAAGQTLVVAATSGDASVTKNSQAGDAITGSAIAHANSITVVNSALVSQGAFIGTVNILGNLEGDILISPSFLPSLVAARPPVTDASSEQLTSDTQVQTDVLLSATSGSASLLSNGTVGDAASGSASTNLIAYTMIGNDLTAGTGLLVFVNVLGEWVGSIVASPQGAVSAFLASDITEQSAAPLAVQHTAATTITHAIQVSARSGDALVAENTTAGSALSGKAMASANVVTLLQNRMALSGWLGVLFINVFGNWHGSFGIDTAYGNLPDPVTPAPIVVPVAMTPASTAAQAAVAVPIRTAQVMAAPALVPLDGTLEAAQPRSDTSNERQSAVLGETIPPIAMTPPSTLSPFAYFALVLGGLGAVLYAVKLLRRHPAEA